MKLPDKIPDGYIHTDDNDKGWRVGCLFTWATGFTPPGWLHQLGRISIRPGESGAEAYERESGEKLRKNDFIFERDM